MNPLLGRWISADPLAVHAAGADLNVYAYVSGAVLKNIDPLGLHNKSAEGMSDAQISDYMDGHGVAYDIDANEFYDAATMDNESANDGNGVGGAPSGSSTHAAPGATEDQAPGANGASGVDDGQYGQGTNPVFSAFVGVGAAGYVLWEAASNFLNVGGATGDSSCTTDCGERGGQAAATSLLLGAGAGALRTTGAMRTSAAPRAKSGAAPDAHAGASARNVNPTSELGTTGRTQNCVNCAVATDATLSGSPATALPSPKPKPIALLESHFDAKFGNRVSSIDPVRSQMTEAGSGARGIVYGARGNGGHVFNVVNQNGVVRFIDGQTGKAAVTSGYDSFQLLRTN